MKIAIDPKTIWIPGTGDQDANQLEVRVAHYRLGVGATAYFELQKLDTTNPNAPVTTTLASGNVDLKDEQFSAWGQDDTYFATAIAANLGVIPAAPPEPPAS